MGSNLFILLGHCKGRHCFSNKQRFYRKYDKEYKTTGPASLRTGGAKATFNVFKHLFYANFSVSKHFFSIDYDVSKHFIIIAAENTPKGQESL